MLFNHIFSYSYGFEKKVLAKIVNNKFHSNIA